MHRHALRNGDSREKDDGGAARSLECRQCRLERGDGTENVDAVVAEKVFLGEAVKGLQGDGAGTVDEPVEFLGPNERRGREGVEGLHGDSEFGERAGVARGGKYVMTCRQEAVHGGEADATVTADDRIRLRHAGKFHARRPRSNRPTLFSDNKKAGGEPPAEDNLSPQTYFAAGVPAGLGAGVAGLRPLGS